MLDWLFPKRAKDRLLHEQNMKYRLMYTREIHWISATSDDITGYINIWFYENAYGQRKVEHMAVGESRKSTPEHHQWWRFVNLWLKGSIDEPPETKRNYTPKPPTPPPDKVYEDEKVIEVDFKK